jgi:hypothetical protein
METRLYTTSEDKTRQKLTTIQHLFELTLRRLLPKSWKNLKDEKAYLLTESSSFIQRKQLLIIRISYTLSVLIVFGSIFPILALFAFISLMNMTFLEERVTRKMIKQAESEKVVTQFNIEMPSSLHSHAVSWYAKHISFECQHLDYSFPTIGRMIVMLASLMYGAIIFDTSGDEYGWRIGLVCLFVFLVLPLALEVTLLIKKNLR